MAGIIKKATKIIFNISSADNGMVSNIGPRTGKYITASCRMNDRNIARRRYMFGAPDFKIDFSDCELSAWKSWKNTMVVKATVCAL